MPHFFISYAKKDTRQLALKLNDALNALPNVTAWVDKSIKVGQSWELQIQKEIDRCDYMIVLYSPDINRHKHGQEESYMLSEIHYAKRIARKQLIPVMAQPTEPPMSLVMEQYIDFTLSGLSLDDLITAICDETGIAVGAGFIPPAAFSPPPTAPIAVGVHGNAPTPTKPTSLDLMPAPFAWIDIPGKGYSIAKYPITNAQFARFIDAGGYENREWWTEIGWKSKLRGWDWDGMQLQWKETNQAWTQPRFWTDSKWNGGEQPVVGVSWYESVAFCLWMSDVTDEKVILPTEDQWQYAAQGDVGRTYPWGNEWDCKRCNNSVEPCTSKVTSSVRYYEAKGNSQYDVVDMVGNVWEWCLTGNYNKTNDINRIVNSRFLCGGSFDSDLSSFFRCDARNRADPYYGYSNFGFRISRSSVSGV